MNGSQIALDALFPLVLFEDVLEVAIPGRLLARFGNVIQVVFQITWGQLNGLQREGLEILLGNKPRFMRPVKTTSKEKWLVVLLAQLFANPLTDRPVASKLF